MFEHSAYDLVRYGVHFYHGVVDLGYWSVSAVNPVAARDYAAALAGIQLDGVTTLTPEDVTKLLERVEALT